MKSIIILRTADVLAEIKWVTYLVTGWVKIVTNPDLSQEGRLFMNLYNTLWFETRKINDVCKIDDLNGKKIVDDNLKSFDFRLSNAPCVTRFVEFNNNLINENFMEIVLLRFKK